MRLIWGKFGAMGPRFSSDRWEKNAAPGTGKTLVSGRYYEKRSAQQATLFDSARKEYVRRDGITELILERCRASYDPRVTKEDIFYYVYGLLHSPDYRTRFAAALKKMLPRLPLLEKPADFWTFSEAERTLAHLLSRWKMTM